MTDLKMRGRYWRPAAFSEEEIADMKAAGYWLVAVKHPINDDRRGRTRTSIVKLNPSSGHDGYYRVEIVGPDGKLLENEDVQTLQDAIRFASDVSADIASREDDPDGYWGDVGANPTDGPYRMGDVCRPPDYGG